jgi:two-component system response regulator PilR (NtrC family)
VAGRVALEYAIVTEPRRTALIVDDEPDLRELVGITLGRIGIATRAAPDLATARQLLGAERFDVCLTDMRLPDGDGLDLVAWMQRHAPDVPVAVITAHGSVEAAVQALKSGAFDFVAKPLDLAQLRALVQTALKVAPLAPAGSPPPRLLGESPAMREVRAMLARVARTQAPVLISGESGTGKELAARTIHAASARAEGPFVAVNCGAIPAELMESELFGHRKGSFTGATADHPGLFQAADGGTLFLDEIAELPLPLQVKLLRVVQEKAVRAVGATKETPVDVRLLSATHKDLAALVTQGRFRADLFYRLVVIEVHIPPLRERPGDLLPLAERVVRRLADEQGLSGVVLTDAARRVLLEHPFPGNVRELENVLERAVTLAGDAPIEPDHVRVRRDPRAEATPAGEPADLGAKVAEVQREAIEAALARTGHNQTAAARLLGMTLRQLRYRVAKLGIRVGRDTSS